MSVHMQCNNYSGLCGKPHDVNHLQLLISFVSLCNRYCTRTLYRYTRRSYRAYRSRESVYSYGCGFWGWGSCRGTRYQ